jgi:hypothetical protein
MRIAGYIEHPELKITIFHYQNRYSLKFENALFEQTFKLRADDYENVDSVRRIVDDAFIETVKIRFDDMASQLLNIVYNTAESDEIDYPFPEII